RLLLQRLHLLVEAALVVVRAQSAVERPARLDGTALDAAVRGLFDGIGGERQREDAERPPRQREAGRAVEHIAVENTHLDKDLALRFGRILRHAPQRLADDRRIDESRVERNPKERVLRRAGFRVDDGAFGPQERVATGVLLEAQNARYP